LEVRGHYPGGAEATASARLFDRALREHRDAGCRRGCAHMQLLPRKGVLAIAAVIDIALNARGRPVAAKALAHRHRLPPRHLEPVLQALVRHGILKGVRGPRGGYELAREQRRITANDILRAAGTVEEADDVPINGSALLAQVVMPALAEAERSFAVTLGHISVEDLVNSAEGLRKSAE
jgi:Rrf2 family transcriptional regulator, iron-sulfur cluster assembly transcription factor